MEQVEVQLLLVDDSPEDRESIREVLSSIGSLRILEAEDLEQAIHIHREVAPQLTLLDLNLPGSVGLMTLNVFLEARKNAPVVVMTGMHGDMGLRAVEAGAQDFVRKHGDYSARLKECVEYSLVRSERFDSMYKFCRVVSHDIRGPLSTSLSFLDLIDASPHLREECIPTVGRCIRRVLSYTDNLMKYFVFLNNKPVFSEGSVAAVADSIREDLVRGFEDIEFSIEGDMKGRIFEDGLRLILYNLIQNAMKYKDPVVPLKIIVAIENTGDHLNVKFRDNGLGNAEQHFNKYLRLF